MKISDMINEKFEYQKEFDDWIADGNAVEVKDGWLEQLTQYHALFTYDQLYKFFASEYMNGPRFDLTKVKSVSPRDYMESEKIHEMIDLATPEEESALKMANEIIRAYTMISKKGGVTLLWNRLFNPTEMEEQVTLRAIDILDKHGYEVVIKNKKTLEVTKRQEEKPFPPIAHNKFISIIKANAAMLKRGHKK